MEKLISKYMGGQYHIDKVNNRVRSNSDCEDVNLNFLLGEVIDVFGLKLDVAYMYITMWAVKGGLTNLMLFWDTPYYKPMDNGITYMPYEIVDATPIIEDNGWTPSATSISSRYGVNIDTTNYQFISVTA